MVQQGAQHPCIFKKTGGNNAIKKHTNLASAIVIVVFLAALIVVVLGRIVFSEAWYYTYAMGFSGLLLRLLGYLLLLSLTILAILWERSSNRKNRQPVQFSATMAMGADGKVIYQNTQQILGESHRPQKTKPRVASRLISVCCIGLAIYLGVLPTFMDLFSQPVTQDMFFVVHYSRSTTRGGPPGRYYLATYNDMGEPITIGSWKAISLRANMRFSSFETVQSDSGAMEVSFPKNQYSNRPRNGDYALFSATVTYYPHSRTRVGFENVTFYLPESFPPERAERSYYGPNDIYHQAVHVEP